jgi:hypothetical protein
MSQGSALGPLFIPSKDRGDKPIEQPFWADEALMAKNIDKIAAGLGAKIVAQVPDTGAGAFGAARLARIAENIQARLVPGQGLRPGRPTDANWVRHPKVPMSDATSQRVDLLAERFSTDGRKISPVQIAARIIEDALTGLPE